MNGQTVGGFSTSVIALAVGIATLGEVFEILALTSRRLMRCVKIYNYFVI